MADLTASDVTVTVVDRWRVGKKMYSKVTIAYGDGALTYPTGGVPMPGSASFGLPYSMDSLLLENDSVGAILYGWDRTANTILTYFPTQQTAGAGDRAGVEYTGGTTAPAATTLTAIAIGA